MLVLLQRRDRSRERSMGSDPKLGQESDQTVLWSSPPDAVSVAGPVPTVWEHKNLAKEEAMPAEIMNPLIPSTLWWCWLYIRIYIYRICIYISYPIIYSKWVISDLSYIIYIRLDSMSILQCTKYIPIYTCIYIYTSFPVWYVYIYTIIIQYTVYPLCLPILKLSLK